MELLVTLGRTLGFSFAAGVNLYATVAILGLASRFDWVALPPQFAVFDSNWVIGLAIALLRDRVRRRQGALGRHRLGRRPHRDPSARRRLHRGDHARRRVAGRAGRGGAARRRRGGGVARHQGLDAGRRQHLARAVLELGAQPRSRTSSSSAWARWRWRSRSLAFGVAIGLLALIALFSMAIVRAFRRRRERRAGGAAAAALSCRR